jgi:hypothetical protein
MNGIIFFHCRAKFGGAIRQPFVCPADRNQLKCHVVRVNVSDYSQNFGHYLGMRSRRDERIIAFELSSAAKNEQSCRREKNY